MIQSDQDRAIAHIDRISEDQEGYFSSRDGLGYIFHATQDALLAAGLPGPQLLGTMNRLFSQALPRQQTSGALMVRMYETRMREATNNPATRRRVCLFERMTPADQENARRIQAFQSDVVAIQTLLSTLGFVVPERGEKDEQGVEKPHPTRATRLPKIHKNQDRTILASGGVRDNFLVRLGLNFGIGSTQDERAITRDFVATTTQTHTADQDVWDPTGYETTAAVLEGIQQRWKLASPRDLAYHVSKDVLDGCFRQRKPMTGRALYYHLRREENRLAHAAGDLFAAIRPQTDDVARYAEIARQGYTADLLDRLNNQTHGPVDWKSRPQFELAYHVLAYATLYRGAARRVEQHVQTQLQSLADRSPQSGQDEKKTPALTIGLSHQHGKSAQREARPVTPEDFASFYGVTPDPSCFPPFPAFVNPDRTWTLMPDAVRREGEHRIYWVNPNRFSETTDGIIPNVMACLVAEAPSAPVYLTPRNGRLTKEETWDSAPA